jgi:predicted lipid carrier protein YhbT
MIADGAARFFDSLGSRGHEPLLETMNGSLRFDVTDGIRTERWHVQVRSGDVTVRQEEAIADVVVRVDHDVLLTIISGQLDALAAFLRGELSIDGDVALFISFHRVFPAPSRSRRPK